jgi:hypothetical protein
MARYNPHQRRLDHMAVALSGKSQTELPLAWNLCQTTEHKRASPIGTGGRPLKYSLREVFSTKSSRRVMSRLKSAYADGYFEKPVTFNTMSEYLRKPELTPILNDLLIKSSLPVVRY